MEGGVIQTVKVNGKECKGLIDTGCSRTIVSPKVNVRPESIVAHSRGEILSFNGQAVPHDGEAVVAIEMAGQKVMVRAIMCARVLEGTDVIVGMDVLSQYVVTINRGQLNVAAVATSSGEHRIVEEGNASMMVSAAGWPKADVVAIATADSARQAHADAHAGVGPTLRVARKINPAVTRAEVKRVVRECVPCGEYDPSPVKMQRGSLKVDKVWDRLACDVTHVGQEKFVTIVDCGPSRFAVWQRVNHEDDTEVAACLRKVFEWYSAPKELLMDNGRAFRSKKVEELCNKWAVNRLFRAVYKPRGNGIVERNHRTVKRVKARCGGTVEEAVRVYNRTPRGPLYAVPAEVMFGRSVTNPIVRRARVSEDHPERAGEIRHTSEGSRQYREGDRVVVKPPNARCDTRWSGGTVTKVNSPWNVEVNGVPRHIQDVRLARSGTNEQEAAPRVPQPGIVLDDGPDDPGDRDRQPDDGIEEQLSIPSDSWEDTSSNQTDETRWRSLPFQNEDAFSDQSEAPVAEEVQVPEVQERNAAEVEEATVRRSTRARKIPERYGDWVEDPTDD